MNRREFLAGSIGLASQRESLRGLPLSMLGDDLGRQPHDLLGTTYSEQFLAEKLVAVNQWHPFPKYNEREPWEAVPGDLRAAIVARAEQDQKTGWKVETATTFLEFKRTGNQSDWQTANWGRRAQMQQLLVAEMFEAKGRFIDDIANGIWLICEETTWSDNAHMFMQRAGVGLPDVSEPVVDLFAAETSATLAWTRYLIGEQLDRVSPLIGKRIALECERRILEPARDRDNFQWMGLIAGAAHTHRLNNWTPWINSNLIVTNLLLEEDPKLRLHEMTRITRSVDAYLNQYWPDAGEEEGPTYYTRSPLCLFECLYWLESATGNSTQVFTNPFIDAMGRYIMNAHIAGDCFINYGDADMHLNPDGDLIYRYGKMVHDDQLAGFGAYCASMGGWTANGKGLDGVMNSDLISLSRAIPAILSANEIRSAKQDEGLVRDVWYPSLGLMTARDKSNSSDGMYVACLAANNGRSHSHNDTGSFILFQDGMPVIIDVGVETYNAKTFSADRYKIWTMESAYHNLPTIDGVMQHDGVDYRATGHRYQSNDKQAVFSFNVASAYPKEAGVKSWVRTVTLDRTRNKVVLEENFELERAVPVSLSLMTPRITKADATNTFQLVSPATQSKPCWLRFEPSLGIKLETEEIPLSDKRLRHDLGEKVYRILLKSKEPVANGKWTYEFSPA
ncbi:MAG TPA: heparinase II/III family protein [Terracidiphilus sp.]|jgi:hypothetical protein|nr:heparinase II/III family protein [Terracidiphilus sp.]